jgi:hypothetical protein
MVESGRYDRSRVKLSFHHRGENFNSLPREVIQDSKHCWTSYDGITPSIYSGVYLGRTFTRSSLNSQFRAVCVASMTLSKGPSAIGIWGAVAFARTATARKSAAEKPLIIMPPIKAFRSLSGIANDCQWGVTCRSPLVFPMRWRGCLRVFALADVAVGEERWALQNMIRALATGRLGMPGAKLVQSAR